MTDNPKDGKKTGIDKILGTVFRIGNKGFYITSGAALMGIFLIGALIYNFV